MMVPIVCLGSCPANVGPHTFGKEGVFPIEFKYKVGTTTRAYFYPPFSFSQNSTVVALFLGPVLSPPPDQLVT